MTVYATIAPRPHHVGQMLRRIPAYQRGLAVRLGFDAHRNAVALYRQSIWCRAWAIDGRLAALGGVVGTMLCDGGFLWLALAEFAMRHVRAVVREARSQLAEILALRHFVETVVLRDDARAQRFAEFLGFRSVLGPHAWGLTYRLEAV